MHGMWFYNGAWHSDPPSDDDAEHWLNQLPNGCRKLADYRRRRELGELPGAAMVRTAGNGPRGSRRVPTGESDSAAAGEHTATGNGRRTNHGMWAW